MVWGRVGENSDEMGEEVLNKEEAKTGGER